MIAISLLLPTRGRPDSVARLFRTIAQTADDPGRIEVVLYLDADDTASHSLSHDRISVLRLIRPRGEPMGKMMGACFESSHGRYVMLVNDDVVFRTRGWDTALIAAFQRFPDEIALVYGNDLDQGKHVPSFPALCRKACEVMGELVAPGYLNLHLESHILDIFRDLERRGHDRIVYLPNVVFEHLHHVLGKSRPDATSKKRDPSFDEQLFLSLGDDRRMRAARLARAIEGGPVRMPTASVIIPFDLASMALAGRTVDGLLASEESLGEIEVVLVADPEGQEAGFLHAAIRADQWKMIRGAQRLSYSAAVNLGVSQAGAEWAAIVRSGCVPGRGWLSALRSAAAEHAAAVVGCRIAEPRNGRLHHGGIGFRCGPTGFRISNLYRGLPADHAAASQPRELQAVSGVGLLVQKRAFLEVGGFSENAEGIEGVDFCLKIRCHGGRVRYEPKALLWYRDHPRWTETHHRIRNRALLRPEFEIRDDLEALVREAGVRPPPDLDLFQPLR